MKLYQNLTPQRAWKYIAVCLVAGFTSSNAQHLTLNTYSNQTEIKATGSITLTDGFYIPAGKNVRIFTGASFQQCVDLVSTPSADQNYISTKVFKKEGVNEGNINATLSTCEVNQTVQYFDGLGRPLQTVTVQGSPGFKDVVQPVDYDAFGREQFKYLPYSTVTGANGSFKPSAITSQAGFYNSPPAGVATITNTAFSESRFEASPLNRVLERGSPGASWQLSAGHTQKMEYGSNNSTDYAVRLYQAVPSATPGEEHKRILSGTGYYTANELYLSISKDENWASTDGKAGTTEEYKDKEDRVVLKRVFNYKNDVTETLSTYYVYDDLGNLSFVLPPGANPDALALPSQTLQDQFCYQYRYDGRKRLIEKKLPGKDWEYMVYNKLDQLVLSQDSLQRVANQWLFTKYDALGRVAITGVYGDGASRSSLAGTLNSQSVLWENRLGSGTDYDNGSFPQNNIAWYHTINYYDDYNFPGNSFPQPDGVTQMSASRVKGLQTGSFVYQVNSSTRYLSVNYYDKDGRVLKTAAENHLGGTDLTENTWNFAGELTGSTRTHSSGSGPATTIATRHEYDHMGRKKATMESINGQPEVVLSKLDYNELGQLSKKWLHSTDGNTFLQHTDYAYNERGWLKRSISGEFSIRLGYDTLGTPQYNGNITSQEWGTGYTFPSIYNYGYDKLNRLLSGVSTGAISMSEVLSYDVMGNISTLNRDGAGAGSYIYEGNRLKSISGGGLAAGSYAYDGNGNAVTDGRTGVNLTYNHLNLPITVNGSGLNIAYTYDAMGRKLKKVSNMEAPSDYVDGVQYTGGAIEFIMTEEGKARSNGGTYSYEYNLTDHLGNVRYTFYQHPSLGTLQPLQADDYYAFGKQRVASAGVNKYLYNGKELQSELGQLDYGARFYDPVIGRWNVVDPLAEKYHSYSIYSYVVNNPIALIDPNGMEIQEIAGGVRFTKEDAQSAYRVLTSKAKNVYMAIVGESSVRSRINEYQKKNGNGQWAGFAAKNFSQANLAMSVFGDKSINNFVLETHGGNDGAESFMRINEDGSSNPESYIYNNEVSDFNKGIQNPEVSQLSAMASKVKDGGNFILAACYVGIGEPGNKFGQNLSKLTGDRLNIFLPQSFVHTGRISNPSGTTIQFDGSLKVDNGKGWLGVTPNGSMQNINKILLSRTTYPPVRIIK
ncbi:DUF6443 domain-containing protein [Pedobacter heparinus]|nr:DUF6443 domain-containing protein [Pedobacter heparinus]